jgi:predicted CoA-substrate-specific enzyme activase
MSQANVKLISIKAIVATGYGRKNVPFVNQTKTEISCLARGCYHYFPEAITIVDIGGQDNKIIKLDAQGKRTGFKMNRKCAAGTGSFLEEIAYKLDIPLNDLSDLAQSTNETSEIGSYCTVFTATEILDRIRAGERTESIVRGLFDSIAKRILEMDTLDERVILTGGVVAYNEIVAELLSARAEEAIDIAPHPQVMGAFGAALFAEELSCKISK